MNEVGSIEPPQLWLIAGANGSGKTSSFERTRLQAPRGSLWIINPDHLAQRITAVENLQANDANLEAVKRIEAWLYASVNAHQSIGVETVLSTDKYRALVETAKSLGFKIRLIYVYLKSGELNKSRVALRVKKGGHDVDPLKIVERRSRSFAQMPWFFAAADDAYVFDNSGAEPKMTIRKTGDEIDVYEAVLPELLNELAQTIPEFSRLMKS